MNKRKDKSAENADKEEPARYVGSIREHREHCKSIEGSVADVEHDIVIVTRLGMEL